MTMTTDHSSSELPNWHSNFAAAAEVASATVHARGTLDVLVAAGCTNITLDLAEVGSVDHAAAWCIAEASSMFASRHRQLTIANARAAVSSALGSATSIARRQETTTPASDRNRPNPRPFPTIAETPAHPRRTQ